MRLSICVFQCGPHQEATNVPQTIYTFWPKLFRVSAQLRVPLPQLIESLILIDVQEHTHQDILKQKHDRRNASGNKIEEHDDPAISCMKDIIYHRRTACRDLRHYRQCRFNVIRRIHNVTEPTWTGLVNGVKKKIPDGLL